MAGGAPVRRALARSDVESYALGVQGDRPLPPGYLVLPAAGEEDVERFECGPMASWWCCQTSTRFAVTSRVSREKMANRWR